MPFSHAERSYPLAGEFHYRQFSLYRRVKWRIERSSAAMRKKNFPESIKHGEVALRLARQMRLEPMASDNLGVVLAVSCRTEEGCKRALELLTRAEEAGFANPMAPIYISKMLLRLKRNTDVIRRLTDYLESAGEHADPKALYYRGTAYFYLKELKKAIEDLNAAEAKGIDFPRLYFLRGWATARQGRLEHALVDFEKAEEAGLDSDVFWLEYGTLLNRLSSHSHATTNGVFDPRLRITRASKALTCLCKVEAQMQVLPDFYGEIGLAKKSLDKWEEAEEHLRKAIEMGAKEKLFLYKVLVELLLLQDKVDEAEDVVCQAEAAGASREFMVEKHARILLSKDMVTQALQLISTAILGGIDSGSIRFSYGAALNRSRRYHDALEELKKAEKMGVMSGALNTEMGIAFFHLDMVDEACRQFEQATTKGVKTLLLMISYARALNSKGDYEGALEQLDAHKRHCSASGIEIQGVYYYEYGFALARLAESSGDWRSDEEALWHLNMAIWDGYRPYYCQIERCMVLLRLGRPTEAQAALDAATEQEVPEKDRARIDSLADRIRNYPGSGQPPI
jgi:tetratricopeptide (TPR) repeat protein